MKRRDPRIPVLKGDVLGGGRWKTVGTSRDQGIKWNPVDNAVADLRKNYKIV